MRDSTISMGKIFLYLITIGLVSAGCIYRHPIRIGYASELTGKNAGIGIQGRNAAEIAISEINEKGGINGRPVELLVRNSDGSPENLQSIVEELLDQGVVALSGHMASWEAMATYPIIQARQIVLLSPTASTPELGGKQDYFFRLIPENARHTQLLVKYAIKNGLQRAAIIYDLSNQAYTQTYAQNFTKQYTELGGKIVGEVTFSQADNPDLRPLAKKLHAMNPDLVLIIASGLNTSLLIQHIRMEDWPVQIMVSSWAYSDELLQSGGKTTEGIVLVSYFYHDCQTPAYLAFKQKYESTYGYSPTFAAALSYESIHYLARAISKTNGSAKGLPEALLDTRKLQGLCEDIYMDEYGDISRTMYLITVKNGTYTLLEKVPPAP